MHDSGKISLNKDSLREVKQSLTNPHALIETLGLRISRETSREIWCFSPFREEANPSFHISKDRLVWYDFGLGKGGGLLELVAAVKNMDIYAAARWTIQKGLTNANPKPSGRIYFSHRKELKRKINEPLPDRMSLIPYLQPSEMLRKRGISDATAAALGAGFLPESSPSPLKGRVVFQIRGVNQCPDGTFKPVILGHIGRALDNNGAKWLTYGGFNKSIELFNFDSLFLDPVSRDQVNQHGLIIVEGATDLANLFEAGIRNLAATLTAHMTKEQLAKIVFLSKHVAIPKVTIWYDNDDAGRNGAREAVELFSAEKIPVPVDSFDWKMKIERPCEHPASIPDSIKDPGDFSVDQIKFLRLNGII